MKKLSIITPCSRPENLPAIYSSILSMNSDEVEWIIIYDSDKIDERIRQYESFVPIILTNQKRGNGNGGMQRNKGLELAKGKWIYFLDDDNLIHKKLLKKIQSFGDEKTILIFNQFATNHKRRIKKFSLNYLRPGYIDTGQFVIPEKYKDIKWPEIEKKDTGNGQEEYDYLKEVIKVAGKENIKFIDRLFTFRNYLRRYNIV